MGLSDADKSCQQLQVRVQEEKRRMRRPRKTNLYRADRAKRTQARCMEIKGPGCLRVERRGLSFVG